MLAARTTAHGDPLPLSTPSSPLTFDSLIAAEDADAALWTILTDWIAAQEHYTAATPSTATTSNENTGHSSSLEKKKGERLFLSPAEMEEVKRWARHGARAALCGDLFSDATRIPPAVARLLHHLFPGGRPSRPASSATETKAEQARDDPMEGGRDKHAKDEAAINEVSGRQRQTRKASTPLDLVGHETGQDSSSWTSAAADRSSPATPLDAAVEESSSRSNGAFEATMLNSHQSGGTTGGTTSEQRRDASHVTDMHDGRVTSSIAADISGAQPTKDEVPIKKTKKKGGFWGRLFSCTR